MWINNALMNFKIIYKTNMFEYIKKKKLTVLKTSNIGNLKENDYITFQLTTKY